MKKLLVIGAVAAVTFFVWRRQSPALARVRMQNQRFVDAVAELEQRADRADTARQSAERQLESLRGELSLRASANSETTVQTPAPLPAPDPARQGGWPSGAGFVYLPKQYLTNAGYQLLNGDHLTDEAAALLGMSAAEREATDKSFGELLDHFRRLEIQRMEAVAPPPGWNVGVQPTPGAPSIGQSFDSALTYRIPDLSADIGTAQKSFLDSLQQNLGAARADIVASAANSFLRQNLDDLGAGERIVGFVWQPESDGTHSLWYANADARNGEGAFQRVWTDLDPNSQTAYYAKLFGVKLPGH